MANPGDKVKVITGEKEYEGILMPNEETDSVVVKLSSGYNVGVEKKKIKKIEVLEKAEPKKESKKSSKENPKLPTILIIHTGGTIASKVDYKTGGVVARFSPEELLEMFPKLKDIANLKSIMLGNMLSENMMFGHYSLFAQTIAKNADKVDGVIIAHGTDTLGYSSAAISFMLENINIPVIYVAAQRSSDRGSSDANINLVCAANFIAKTDFAGVAICMHEKSSDKSCLILPATKTRKLHASRRDAFHAVNAKPIARVDFNKGSVEFFTKYDRKGSRKLVLKDNMEDKVGLIKTYPGMDSKAFEAYSGYKGLVIEGTGLGHAPVGATDELSKPNLKNFAAIKKLADSGCVVVMATQCIFGRVQMHVYSTGIELAKIGVISGEDMLPETAYVKLAWLLGNYKKDEAKKLIGKNLRGEIAERSEYEEEFL